MNPATLSATTNSANTTTNHPDQELLKKPSSDRRVAASRANGAKSNGPTTPEGLAARANSTRNLRHGMLAEGVVLLGESRERFEELLCGLIYEHNPITKTEQALVEMMAAARWRQMRAWSIQTTDFEREMAKHRDGMAPRLAAAIAFRDLSNNGNSLTNGLRYETAFERQFKSALRELKSLQSRKERPEDLSCFASDVDSSTWSSSSFEPLAKAPPFPEEAGENENAKFPFVPNPENGQSV